MVYEGIDYSINFAARRNKSTLDAVLDEGQVFALHEESGLSYGWAKNRMGTYQVIKSRQAPDATQLAGVEWTKRNRDNYWEIKIPNGTYNVHLVTGGIASPDELERVAGWDIDGAGHSINGAQIIKDARVPYVNDYLVEGIRVQDTEPDRIYSFIDCKVDVKDGRLTIKPGPDAVSPRLAGLKISQCQ